MNTRTEFDNAVHIATIEDGPDWVLEVMAILQPWPQHFRDWADEKSGIPPACHNRSAVMPNFNGPSPSARLTKLVTTDDGGNWVYDVAAADSPDGSTTNSSPASGR